MLRFNCSIALSILLMAQVGCESKRTFTGVSDANSAKAVQNVGQTLAARPATVAECASGGVVYSIFQDINGNGVLDPDEQAISSQIVCNGASGSNGSNGANGLNSVFSMIRVNTGFAPCASGRGVQLNYGLDQNYSQVLEPSEILQAQILCDGSDGAAGAAGPAGQNGHSMAFETIAASALQCSNGGSVVLMAVDLNDSGVYSPLSPGQRSITMCNGSNGQDAATPAYATVESILPCGNAVAYKEVLLRLQNGQVLASFSQDSHGEMTRLAFLPDGSYMDTDSSGCTFSLSTSVDGMTRFISWFNQVQASWPMQP